MMNPTRFRPFQRISKRLLDARNRAKGVFQDSSTSRSFYQSNCNRALDLAYTSFESTNAKLPCGEDSIPIIIQHGLLGSRKNWSSLGKAIHAKTGRRVVIPDARNHGDSPHSEELNYQVLSEDIIQLMDGLKIPKADLVGHSMGGRTMMAVALSEPSLVNKLVIVDISPVNVSPGADAMKQFLTVMEDIRLGDQILQRATARKLVDEQLQVVIKDSLLRQFLLTNLVEDNGRYRWRVNLRSIIKNLPNIIGHFPMKNGIFHGPTLFIGGGNSDYIRPSDHERIREIFPDSFFKYIANAGHWVHSEKPADFLAVLLEFLIASK